MMTAPKTQTQALYAIGSACLDVDALTGLLDRPRHKVAKALNRLIERGLVERRKEGCFATSAQGQALIAANAEVPNGAPTTDLKPRRPYRNTLRQRAWTAMRIQRCFTVGEIAMLADRGQKDPEKDLLKWFNAMEAAGYLTRSARRVPGHASTSNGFVRFSLMKNTGVKAPVHSVRHGLLRDPNTGEDSPCRRPA
jgi:hypothetical protein